MKMQTLFPIMLVAAVLAGCCKSPPIADAPDKLTCRAAPRPSEIEGLFDKWNDELVAGREDGIVALYAENSILLPTFSHIPRTDAVTQKAYFHELITNNKPVRAKIVDAAPRKIYTDCNTAIDVGFYDFYLKGTTTDPKHARYTFTYKWNGKKWLITSHHSSQLPDENHDTQKEEK